MEAVPLVLSLFKHHAELDNVAETRSTDERLFVVASFANLSSYFKLDLVADHHGDGVRNKSCQKVSAMFAIWA